MLFFSFFLFASTDKSASPLVAARAPIYDAFLQRGNPDTVAIVVKGPDEAATKQKANNMMATLKSALSEKKDEWIKYEDEETKIVNGVGKILATLKDTYRVEAEGGKTYCFLIQNASNFSVRDAFMKLLYDTYVEREEKFTPVDVSSPAREQVAVSLEALVSPDAKKPSNDAEVDSQSTVLTNLSPSLRGASLFGSIARYIILPETVAASGDSSSRQLPGGNGSLPRGTDAKASSSSQAGVTGTLASAVASSLAEQDLDPARLNRLRGEISAATSLKMLRAITLTDDERQKLEDEMRVAESRIAEAEATASSIGDWWLNLKTPYQVLTVGSLLAAVLVVFKPWKSKK